MCITPANELAPILLAISTSINHETHVTGCQLL